MATVTPSPSAPTNDELAGCLAEQAHLLDPADTAFARLACQSDCCSTESGDPVWDAWLAQRITETRAAWTAAHTKTGGQR